MAPGLQELTGGELEFLGETQQLTHIHASAALFKKELDKGDKVGICIQKEAVSGGEISQRRDGYQLRLLIKGSRRTSRGIGQGLGSWKPMREESRQQCDCKSILGDLCPKILSLPSALVKGD